MKMYLWRSSQLVLLCASIGTFGAWAQPLPPGQAAQNFQSIADLVQALGSTWGNVPAAVSAGKGISRIEPTIRDSLMWSGAKGYLLETGIQTDLETGMTVRTGVTIHWGLGPNPSTALALGLDRPQLESIKSDPLNGSLFVWVQLKDGKLLYYPQTGTDAIRLGALSIRSEKRIAEVSNIEREKYMASIVETMRSRQIDTEAVQAVQLSIARAAQAKALVKKLDEALAAELQRAAAADQLLLELGVLRSVLTAAELAVRAESVLGEPIATSPGTPRNADTVDASIRTIAGEQKQRMAILQGRRDAAVREAHYKELERREQLRKGGGIDERVQDEIEGRWP